MLLTAVLQDQLDQLQILKEGVLEFPKSPSNDLFFTRILSLEERLKIQIALLHQGIQTLLRGTK